MQHTGQQTLLRVLMAQLKRLTKHLMTTSWHAKRVFPDRLLQEVEALISQGETQYQAELRFVIEPALPWSYLQRGAAVRERAMMLFSKLRIWDTVENNGVLVYICLADRQIEIVADRGINACVPQATWDAVCNGMRHAFRQGEYQQGCLQALQAIQEQLVRYFPARTHNPNELSDRPLRF